MIQNFKDIHESVMTISTRADEVAKHDKCSAEAIYTLIAPIEQLCAERLKSDRMLVSAGWLYLRASMYEEAISCADKAIESNPQNTQSIELKADAEEARPYEDVPVRAHYYYMDDRAYYDYEMSLRIPKGLSGQQRKSSLLETFLKRADPDNQMCGVTVKEIRRRNRSKSLPH
jgi:tetratricopeptide (TPR) repeat protein